MNAGQSQAFDGLAWGCSPGRQWRVVPPERPYSHTSQTISKYAPLHYSTWPRDILGA